MSFLDRDALDGIGTVSMPLAPENKDNLIVADVGEFTIDVPVTESTTTRSIWMYAVGAFCILLIGVFFAVGTQSPEQNLSLEPSGTDSQNDKGNGAIASVGRTHLAKDTTSADIIQNLNARDKPEPTRVVKADNIIQPLSLAKEATPADVVQKLDTRDKPEPIVVAVADNTVEPLSLTKEATRSDIIQKSISNKESEYVTNDALEEVKEPKAETDKGNQAQKLEPKASVKEVVKQKGVEKGKLLISPVDRGILLFTAYYGRNKFKLARNYFEDHKEYLLQAKNCKGEVIVEGHTCDIGDYDYNLRLGQQRANAVKQTLTKKGIDPERIDIESHGERFFAKMGITDETIGGNKRKFSRRVSVYCKQ